MKSISFFDVIDHFGEEDAVIDHTVIALLHEVHGELLEGHQSLHLRKTQHSERSDESDLLRLKVLHHLSQGVQVNHLLIRAKLRRTGQYDVVGLRAVARNLVPAERVHEQLLLIVLRVGV